MNHCVHMCNFVDLSTILEEGIIETKKFVSFSNEMPLRLGHGDSAIVFNVKKLSEKGYNFQKIKYTKKYLKKNPDIKEHILEYKTDEQLREHIIKISDKRIEDAKLRKLPDEKINAEIIRRRRVEELLDNDLLGVFLKGIWYENEIVVESPLEFDEDDIVGIIHLSRTFNKYYPVNSKYSSKILFLEDFESSRIRLSPLSKRMNNVDIKLGEYEKLTNQRIDGRIIKLHHLAYLLTIYPDWKKYIDFQQRKPIDLPPHWDNVFKEMHNVEQSLKLAAINLVTSKYILESSRYLENSDYEKTIIEQITKKVQ